MRTLADLRIDGYRMLQQIEALGQVGAREDGSCCRLALTDDDRVGRDTVVAWMRELGLGVRIDRVGNIFGLRRGSEDLPPVMTGSHIDTVATGGKFDGAYGVLAGLELIHTLNDAAVRTRRPIAVAVFTNEEGVRFHPDMLGSLAYAGGLDVEDAWAIRASDGALFGEELARIGYSGAVAPGSIVPRAFVELHIEQGPILDAEGECLGAVGNLQGISWQEVTIRGVANHAGTTPMRMRRDAAYGAARTVCFVRDLTREIGGTQVGTVGSFTVAPNLVNVIPREAVIAVDLRNTDESQLQEAERRLDVFLRDLAAREGLEIRTRRLARFEPVVFDTRIVSIIQEAAEVLGHPIRPMTSGAGQDAQMLARLCPAAMVFVPSVGGISHSPAEYTRPEHLELGANVLLQTVLRLAE
jgi:beta-ureidopropionase / N-carbamoyl-L-amino-acid hydrolase